MNRMKLAALAVAIAVLGAGAIRAATPVQARTTATSLPYATVCPVIGNGQPAKPTTSDGTLALEAELRHPSVVAADDVGNVYMYSTAARRIQRIDAATSAISTVAGGGAALPNVDGAALAADVTGVLSMAIDAAGTELYFVQNGSVVRRVTLATGVITTVLGVWGQSGPSASAGPALSPMGDLRGLALSGSTLYVSRFADSDSNGRLLGVDLAAGTYTVVAGGGSTLFNDPTVYGEGEIALNVNLGTAHDVAIDGLGRVYVVNGIQSILRFDPVTSILRNVAGINVSLVGNGVYAESGDGGPATDARLLRQTTIAGTPDGIVIAVLDGEHDQGPYRRWHRERGCRWARRGVCRWCRGRGEVRRYSGHHHRLDRSYLRGRCQQPSDPSGGWRGGVDRGRQWGDCCPAGLQRDQRARFVVAAPDRRCGRRCRYDLRLGQRVEPDPGGRY